MNDTSDLPLSPRRRLAIPGSSWRRIGVLWPADLIADRTTHSATVLDITPQGAKLRIGIPLFGELAVFWLAINSLGLIECAPVWRRHNRMGVRFLSGAPTEWRLRTMITTRMGR